MNLTYVHVCMYWIFAEDAVCIESLQKIQIIQYINTYIFLWYAALYDNCVLLVTIVSTAKSKILKFTPLGLYTARII